jgi:subtilisin family serine protease
MLTRVLVVGGLLAGLLVATPARASAVPATIEPALQSTLDASGSADFWVRFDDRADLSQVRQVTGWTARGAAVVEALRETAETSQAAVRATLDGAGQRYRAHFATNAIYVYGGSPALATELAGSPGVQGLYEPTAYRPVEPAPAEGPEALQTLAWGIENIRANQVWDEFGARGEGITVATIDSGVQYDHPALVAQYRGNLGDGRFDHNHNWFDASGICPDAPCDPDGHGTHVTGTMVGDDGGANQIGVAPEANWIATNGCCPSDETLITSGEWLLAPADLAGDNPDPARRPHIINNSWGTIVPSSDPFMEDVLEAWAAAGIFAMWSNGNNGPGCETAGSPGSRIVAYAAGAHGADNAIADFSSRGPGQDGRTKPNISAPGVAIRSSLPGGTYGSFDGTSMASPHVAGTVALLWSAAPGLVGDPEATIELLNLSAVDAADPQCGGTAGNNNVYGEGRLDALGLLRIAPIDGIGTLAGTVVDAAGAPVVDATVTVAGPVQRVRTIGADGDYAVLLPAGDYTVTVSAFGYATQRFEVGVAVGERVTRDVTLAVVGRVTLRGRVTDGSGHGWPMYARIRVDGTPVSTYTDPADGSYQLRLPAGEAYSLVVTSQYPDYQAATVPIEAGTSDLERNIALDVDAERCTAAGYEFGSDGTFTTFNHGGPPAGWTIVDNLGEDRTWRFDNPGQRPNLTGGDGVFATVDGTAFGNTAQDTELRTPVLDFSDVADPVIRLDHAYARFFFGDQEGRIDLSLDGGGTWRNLLHLTDEFFDHRSEEISIPEAAGVAGVQVRFHYTNSRSGFWWQLDNVLVGSEVTCDPIEGGLVAGHVRDRNTGTGVAGATVHSGEVTVESQTTPDDPATDDGFYWLFLPAGERDLAGSADRYASHVEQVEVAPSSVTFLDLRLPAGRLSVAPASVTAEVQIGRTVQRTFTVTNTGTAPADLALRERGAPVAVPAGAGAVQRLPGPVTDLSLASVDLPAAAPPVAPAAAPWQRIADYPFRVLDNLADSWDGRVYSVSGVDAIGWRHETMRYDPANGGWTELAPIPTAREKPNGAIIDGEFYVVGGWDTDGDTTIPSLEIYDIATDTWREGAPIPTAWAASGSAVLDGKLYLVGGCRASCGSTDVWVYDPAADTWTRAAPYPRLVSWTHCGAIDGRLYCAGGSSGATAAAYVYDPGTDQWRQIASIPQSQWGGASAVANGKLVVSGGVVAGLVSNQGYPVPHRRGAGGVVGRAGAELGPGGRHGHRGLLRRDPDGAGGRHSGGGRSAARRDGDGGRGRPIRVLVAGAEQPAHADRVTSGLPERRPPGVDPPDARRHRALHVDVLNPRARRVRRGW